MSLEALASKYIVSAEKVLKEMRRVKDVITVNDESVNKIIEYATAYLADAKYYKAQKRFETSLTSIAYCEGLLDALKLLGAVKFEWPTSTKSEK
jgi:FAD synthetase